jgi:hypothetical protein
MARKSAAKALANWQKGVQGAQAEWLAQINATQKDPMRLAIKEQQKLLINFTNSVNNGLWAKRLGNVTVAQWQAQCKAAAPNYTTGAMKGGPKYQKFITAAQGVYDAMKAASVADGGTPQTKSSAALTVLLAAGRKANGQFAAL